MQRVTQKALTILLWMGLGLAVTGQTVDTGILGTVTDAGQAAVPNATVVVSQPANGFSRTLSSGPNGLYEVRYLVPGDYDVEVRANGFSTQRKTGIHIQIGQQAKIDFSLQLGTVQQTVEVTSSAPLLVTETATLGGVVSSERINNLPLNGRKFNDLAILTPGVQVSNPNLNSSSTNGSRISSNGGRNTWGQVNIDGITMVNNRSNYVNIYPSIDAIQEFKVQTGNYTAEYGGNAGTNINVQLKSGTNSFHGDAFEFLRNYAMDARNFFVPSPLPQSILKQNQFGGTIGGPIVHDKTFFFASYEGIRSIAQSPATAVVLTPAERNGVFSSPVRDPLSASGAFFPNNTIPQSRIDPVAQRIVNAYMPLPNTTGTTNYSGASTGDLTVNQGIARIDHYFSEHDQLFAHYVGANRSFPNIGLNPFFSYNGSYPMHNVQGQWVHTFTPTLINELRGGFDLENVSLLSTRTNTNFTIASLGINGFLIGGPAGRVQRPDEQGFPILNIAGYLGMGDSSAASNLDNSRTYQFVDNLTYVRGPHTIKVGADVRRLLDNATTNNTPFGSMSFTTDIAGNAAASYLLGFPRTVLTPEGVPITASRQWRNAFYGQDDWKVSSRLTLNLGVRWDLFGVPKDINGVSRTLLFPAGGAPTLYPSPGTVVDSLWDKSWNNVSPRIGLAYRATQSTVVRAGYGIFYFGGQFDNINILQLNPPAGGSITVTNPATNPVATISNPVPASLFPSNPIFNAVSLPPDRRHPNTYVQNWNFQVGHQFGTANLLEVSYVGSKGTHVDTSYQNFNQPDPGPGPIQARRPYPQFARIRMQNYGVNTSYNALQARFERRLRAGISASVAYSFSHLIDDAGETTNGGGCICQSPRDRSMERASGLQDQRHNLVSSFVWEIPFGRNLHGPLNVAFAGWAIDGILTLASGQPFNITQSFDGQNNDGLWERPNLVPGQSLSVPNQGPSAWFNTSAFTGSILQYGNSPRNPFVGPGTHVINTTLRKAFPMPFGEGQRLEFRAETFNTTNTPVFSNPVASLGTSTFGRITSTRLDNRQIQLALKYYF
jgi:outer membrane receptor protein involved in Fe transport